MGFFSGKNNMPVDGKTVLLTGASQGMGRSAARLLATKGANIIIVARDQAKLDSTISDLKAAAIRPTQRFHAISADVRHEAENARILREATAWNDGFPPDVVWAIAGSSAPSLFLDSSATTMRNQMDLNYWSAVYLTRETIQAWLSPSSLAPSSSSSPPSPRHIILTSSTIAFVTIAGYSPYAPAKAALRSFSDSLRSELNLYNGARRHTSPDPAHPAPPPTDILIHTVLPGSIDSPGLVNENLTKHDVTVKLEESDPIQSPDEVAGAAIRGLEEGRYLITVNWFGRLMAGVAWMGSPRGNWLVDTLISCVASWVMLFVLWDMEKTVWAYGKKWGLGGKPKGGKDAR